ncbi:MAG: YidC/Oxa1 family membrane protein insertase, partial [Acidimicrobiales bacterium]
FIALVALAVVLQYVQMRQMNGRNPQANMNPQAAMMQKVMPIVFVFIYISIPAGVNVYFVVSSLFRIGQQELMYRYDPKLASSVGGSMLEVGVVDDEAKKRPQTGTRPGTSRARRTGFLAALAERAAASQANRNGSPARTNAKNQVKPPRRVPPADKPARAKNGAGDNGAGDNGAGDNKALGNWNRGTNGTANGNGAANGADKRDSARNAGKKSHPRSQAKKARRAR